MTRWEDAFRRAFECQHPFVRGKKKSDFRNVDYAQIFTSVAAGATSGNQLQTFPAGAFVLAIQASAVVPKIMKADQYYADAALAPLHSTVDRPFSQCPGNIDLFSLNFSYTNDENITPGGPVNAASLLGLLGNAFPARELIIDPSQGILAQVRNDVRFQAVSGAAAESGITYPIDVHITYVSMVPRAVG